MDSAGGAEAPKASPLNPPLIYNPVIFPGEDNGIIYIAKTDSSNLCAMQEKSSREEGFLRGASIAEKWGFEIFWGKCLKITRFSDLYRYFLYIY